jgi:hypothetical protein
MKFYMYTAKDHKGFPCRGSIRAESEDDAIRLLSLQNKVIESIELDVDATKKLRPETINNLSSGLPKKSPWNEILSYAMPIGAMIIALIGIPIMMNFVKPPTPERKPTEVIADYFALENKGSYKKQYELLSENTAEIFESAENYAKKKSKWYQGSDGQNLSQGKLTGLEELDSQLRRATYKARYLRMNGVQDLEITLVLKKSDWTIDSVRDSVVLNYYLQQLYYLRNEDQKNKYLQELKAFTSYSDLEVDEALTKYSYRQDALSKKS